MEWMDLIECYLQVMTCYVEFIVADEWINGAEPASSSLDMKIEIHDEIHEINDENSKLYLNEESKKLPQRHRVVIPKHVRVIKGADRGKPTYKCTVCNRKFKVKKNVKYHEYCADKSKKKPFRCHLCSKGFIAKTHFEYHQRTHWGPPI
jgi:hypothetical protein